jgi:sugar O-acyltransferase (sialic acid O-acetyltransferase NeuD family)
MNKIYIIGASGFAKEVYCLLRDINTYEIGGFIDKNPINKNLKIGDDTIEIIDEDFFLENFKNCFVCIGIGSPKIINIIVNKYKNYVFPNIIHPSFIGNNKSIFFGIGNVITAGVIFTTNIKIGSFNIFNINMTLGHDSIIGDENVFNPSTNISGNNKIGNSNLFGVGSISLENMEIGDNNIIGASALITKNVNNNGVYMGIPSKLIKNNHK